MPALLPRLQQRILDPAPVASLVVLRVGFGLIVAAVATVLLAVGWVSEYARTVQHAFPWLGFEGWRVPASPWLEILTAAAALAGLAVAVGWCYRAAALVLTALLTWALLGDRALYSNTLYLFCLVSFWLALSPAGRALAVDTLRQPERRLERAPAWTLWMLRIQTSFVYLFAAAAKLDADWLAGRTLAVWLGRRTDDPVLGWFFALEWSPVVLAWAGFLFDLLIVPALAWRKTRVLAFVSAVVFHAFNAIWLGVFPLPVLCVLLTTLFLSPDWPLRLPGLRSFPSEKESSALAAAKSAATIGPRRWVIAFSVVYLALQVVAPLRHHLYTGDVSWNEWGHPFSWRLRARAKDVDVKLFVIEGDGQFTRMLRLEELHHLQARCVQRNPDVLLAYCRRRGEELRTEETPELEIRARVRVSLNGRPWSVQVDPAVDLSREPTTIQPPDWILYDSE